MSDFKKKVLFPLGMFYPTSVGGPSNTLYWHTCYLAKNQIDTLVVTTDFKLDAKKHNIPLNTWIKNEVGNVIYCKTRNKYLPFRAIYETIRKIFSVDIIHYSSAYYYLTIYTLFLSVLLNKKVVLSPRGEFFDNAIDSFKKKVVIRLYKFVYKKILFHATSNEEKESILKLFPKANIVIQPNFIQIETANKTEVKNKNIVFLGIIYGVKKIENIIKAIPLSKNFDLCKSKFLIAGKPLVKRDFEYKEKLERLITELNLNDKVEFIGEIFGKEKHRFLNDAYLLLLPSESENFGNVIVESLSQSTPVIASKGTPWKILKDENAGWWVDNDPVTLSEVIDEALSLSEEEYLKKCRNSLDLLNKKFNINSSEDNHWLEIYNNLRAK